MLEAGGTVNLDARGWSMCLIGALLGTLCWHVRLIGALGVGFRPNRGRLAFDYVLIWFYLV